MVDKNYNKNPLEISYENNQVLNVEQAQES
jgi:hypothetical protein